MTDISFMKMLIENHVLILTGPITDSLRKLGWLLISGLVSLVDGLENITTRIYSFNDFFNSKGVNDLLNAYKPLIYGIFIVALLFLGYSVMLQKKKDRSEIPTNILISAMVIIALPIFMTKLGDLTQMFVNYNISEQHSSAKEIVKDNISDLYYLDRTNFKMNEKKNDIPTNDIMNIDINETLDANKIKNRNYIFKRKLILNEKNEEVLIDLDKGFFGLFEEGYYRYNANFMIIIISLAITGITLLCISLKVIGIIFELGFKKIFATIIAMADISDGRKLKAIVVDIMSSFAILMVTSVLLKMYIIFSAFLGSKAGNYSILSLVALAGVSWKVIDAPDIVERILGIDAGVKSNWASVLAGYEGIKGASRAIRGAGQLAKKGFSASKNAFSSLGDRVESSQGNNGIYGSENSESNSISSNINNNTNQSNTNSSNSKNNGSNMNSSNNTRSGDINNNNNRNNKIIRNNGIYNKSGDNINNSNNSKENSNSNNNISNNGKGVNSGNNNINTDKGKSIYNKGNNTNGNTDKNINGNNRISGRDNGNNINMDKGKSIYENTKNKTPNNENLNNNSNSMNDKNNFSNKTSSTNLNSGDNNYSKSNNRTTSSNNNNNNSNSSNNTTGGNKFNIKDNSKSHLNNEKNRNYRVGNQNKWNIKEKEKKN